MNLQVYFKFFTKPLHASIVYIAKIPLFGILVIEQYFKINLLLY